MEAGRSNAVEGKEELVGQAIKLRGITVIQGRELGK
jgi:hypothetical protein